MSASHTLDVTVATDSPAMAEAVAKALRVETNDLPPRTRVTVEARGAELLLHIDAEETRGLRAAAHSFLRWADASIAAARAVGPG